MNSQARGGHRSAPVATQIIKVYRKTQSCGGSQLAALICLACASLAAATADPTPAPEPAEIIVTGERVARTLRETPSSVSVVEQGDIEANGANRVDQLLALIPNVQLGNGSQGPAIRGMDTTGPLYALPAFLGGNRPRTVIIVDGRPVTYNEFVFGTFPAWDVNRIEVFRSPQTTTQGQNSIAGAIFVNTNDPSSTSEYRARAIVGDFHNRQLSALASGPLGDDVRFRVAGDLRYARTTSRIVDLVEDAEPSHDVYGIIRAKLLMNPGADTRVTLAYVHTQSQSPQVIGISPPFRERRDKNGGYGVFRVNVDSLTAVLRQRVSRELSGTVTLSAGDSSARRLAIPNFGQTRNDGRDWSADAVLNWTPGGPLHVVGGASHSHVELRQFINLSLLSGSIGRFQDWQDSSGIFADASIAFSPRTTITAGIRYQRDRQKRQGALTANSFEIPVDFIGNFHAWLPKVTAAYDVTSGLRIGAMLQKAYNPGGTTIRVDTGRPDEFKTEMLWDYELFARSRFANGKATASANLFYYNMRNAQRAEDILVFAPSGARAGFANLFNVPKARSYGAEADLDWRISDALSATVAIGLLDTKIVRVDSESAHLQGNEFDRSPRFSASAAIDWRPKEQLRLSVQLRHHSAYFSDPENTPKFRVDSVTNLDARAEYWLKRFAIFAQVRNLFDSFNVLDLGVPHPLTGAPQAAEAEDPRMIAVGLETRF